MHGKMIFLLLCLIFFIPNDVAPACPTGWTLDAGHCYMWDTTRTARNFSKATEFCQSNNGYVVNIETYEENDFLRNYTLDSLGSLEYIWLGITYLEENGRWRWYITNHTAYYTNWYQSPVNITDNCSVAHVNGSDLEWFVSPCNDSHFTICEKGEHCPAGWDGYYEGSCYYMDSYYMDSFYNDYYHHRRRNFFEAVEFCQNMSGHVITLETSEESDSFYNYTRRLRYHYHIYDTWFGVTNIGANETWRWYNTNENVIYTNWNPGQPDQDPHKNCSFVLIYHAMVWYSRDCSRTTGMTICEKDIGYISPVFAREHNYFYQDEDIPVGATVGIVAATHIETGTSGDIVYSIAEGDVDSKFDIEQTSGALILMAELDFETATVNPYVIVVHAKKNDSAYFQTWTASVILPINDVNDNAPVCEPVTEALTVYENVTPPVDIAHLSCTDHDSLDNAVLTFTITHANHIASMFAITKSGIISLVQSVDFETKTGHEVIIHVEDGGTASFTTTVNLTVTVLDVNDGKPMFELSTYQKFVSESEPAGSTVLTMTVTDTDVADTTFTFNIDSGNVDNIFDVSGNTEIANLIINDTSFLNYETTRNYNLVLRASDKGGLFSTTSVNISITNYNEHFPVVVSPIPSPVHVAENVPSGHVVAVIEATDADHGDAGEVTYTVVSGTNNQFAIDTKSGIVTSTISLDRESISSYEITVNITDGGTIPGALTSKFTLLVNVTDVNDIAPVCRSLNGASVPADAPPGTIVAQLDCTDGDATPPYNMISTYAITRGNVGVAFVISRTGEVKTAKQLDIVILDNYFLEINVSDAGPTPLQTTTTLAITVLGQLTFAYGIEARDSFLQTGNGGLSGKITTSYGIPISDGLYYTIYICKDGLISLGEPYCNLTPSANLSSLHGRTVISPYHASIKLQESSNVSFRWFDIHNISSTYDKDKALDLMEMFIEDDNFQPAFILIVTWVNVVPLRTDVRPGEMATFQLLLLSDGFITFTSFQYARGQMNWLPRKYEQTYIRIGYNFPGYSYTHLSSFTQSAFRTDKLTEINGQSGLLFYRLTNNDNPIRNDAMTCLIWYYGNVGLQENMYSLVPRCPCNTERLRFDPSFRGLFNDGSIHRNTECFVSWPSSILGTSGTTCCYDSETGLFISQRPRSGGFIQYHPFLEPVKHDIYDKRIKEQCCVYSNLCDFYYGLRPDSDCYTDTRFRQSTFWGDPHFQTLDGYDFTYNGLGEYILLQIDDGDIFFTIQARTIQALDVDGMGVNATVFGAFAARDNSGAALHVELDASKTGLIIYGNDKDLTKQLEDEPVYVDSEQLNMCLMRYNDSLDAYFSLTQTLMTITVSNAMLDLRLVVAETFSGNTRGLLGNYDENSENDIVLRNGSFVSLDPTGEEINSFGQSWQINMSESAFKYEQGKNTSDYTDINFNWSAQNILANISADEGSCEGNLQCIFDLMLTRNENLTQHTKAVAEFATHVREKLDNSVPSVQGCDLITNARLGEFVTCRITMRDDKDNTSIVVKQSLAFANISITYADETTTTADLFIQVDEHLLENDISVVAIDVEGESSSPIVINLLICNNCNGHGHCDLGNARRDKSNSGKASLLAACICEPYWTGEDCETDFDGCAASPCSHGRTCADKTASYHSATGVSYTCDPCPSGYIDNGSACIDDDECVNTNGGCGQECINTDGSYVCLCLSGYRADNNLCIDINECDEDLHDCKHICSNIDGGYNCSCHPGYQLNSDLQECVLITDDNPCSEKCLDADGCINVEDETSCFCNAGFSLTENETCIDTNECDSNVCQQGCTNGPGNYTCFCYSGYILEADNTCIRCNDTHWGPDCAEECRCIDMGAAKCDPVIGCICKTGWEGKVCETDVDECVTIPNVCDPNQRCVNQPGSYQCVCRDGFIKDEEDKCVDINECGQKAINNCTGIQLCRNTNGGYICECKKGYTADMNGSCRDIDECLSEVSHCEQLCENVAGQYNCYCIYGYRLNQDRQTCVKDPRATDICQTYNMSCSQLCLHKDGNTTCGCRLGYKLALDKTSCIDIDECASEKTNLCSDRDTCHNTEGGYTCACAAGYKLGRDNRTCLGCDKYHFGPNCIHECDCGPGSSRCDPLLGCRCNPGWMGAQCDTDRDECAVLQNPCMGDHQECINTPGAFRCRCKFGYVNTSDHGCEDSDECEHQTKHHCDQLCVNTDGSYRCDCRPGFIRSGSKCIDIDECVGQHGCAHSCVNTLGGYRCSCKSGFKLDLENRRACLPKLLCENTKCTNGTCVIHDNGTEDCVCNKGFVMVDGVCSDVDECEARPCASECNNLLGGYRCTCPVGSKLDVDYSSCVACGSGMYGAECADMCDCTADRTTSCDPVNGTCVCMAGWTGARCNVDINECKQAECPTSSECNNTNGSWICQCLTGFFKTSSGLCQPCDRTHYGQNCEAECMCKEANTMTCDNNKGTCTCLDGWQGDDCNMDVNECEEDVHSCRKAHQMCNNTNGSFVCTCESGYKEIDETCKDINECLENEDTNCLYNCTNTDGSYECMCPLGMEGHWNDCYDCSRPNTYGMNCSSICPCEKNNTISTVQSCDPISGQCICLSTWTGARCEEDVNECALDTHNCTNYPNTGCRNVLGGFYCDCLRRYVYSHSACIVDDIPVEEDPIPAHKTMVPMQLTIVNPLDAGTNLQVTSVYTEVKTDIETMLLYTYKPFAVKIQELEIRDSSLLALYDILCNTTEGDIGQALVRSASIMSSKQLELTGQIVNVTNILYIDTSGRSVKLTDIASLCVAFEDLYNCSGDHECIISSQKPTCIKTETREIQVFIIIGIAGASVVLLFVIVTVALCIRNGRRKSKKANDRRHRSPDDGFDVAITGNVGETSPSSYSSPQQESANLTWRTQLSKADKLFQIKRPKIEFKPNPLWK